MPDLFEALIAKGESKLEPVIKTALAAAIRNELGRFNSSLDKLADMVTSAEIFADLWARRGVLERVRTPAPRARIQFGKGAPGFERAAQALVQDNPWLLGVEDFVREVYERRRDSVSLEARRSIQDRVDQLVSKQLREGATEFNATKALSESQGWTRGYSTTVYRTNVANAYAAGEWSAYTQPEIKRLFPALIYDATMDGDTRPNHGAANGLIAAVDDPIWERLAPPLGWNCRCSVVSLSAPKLRRMGLLDAEGRVTPRIPAGVMDGRAHMDEGFFRRARPDRTVYGG